MIINVEFEDFLHLKSQPPLAEAALRGFGAVARWPEVHATTWDGLTPGNKHPLTSYCRATTVSPSDVSTSFGIQISTVETSVCMLLILFQTAHNITFSQVDATCLSPAWHVPFFLLLDAQLTAKCAKHCSITFHK